MIFRWVYLLYLWSYFCIFVFRFPLRDWSIRHHHLPISRRLLYMSSTWWVQVLHPHLPANSHNRITETRHLRQVRFVLRGGTVVRDPAGAFPSAVGNGRAGAVSLAHIAGTWHEASSESCWSPVFIGRETSNKTAETATTAREGGASLDAPYCPLQVSDRTFY